MKLNERKTEMAHYEICVNCYYSHKIPMITESFAIMPTKNVQYLPFIFSGFIFGNKDQYSPWQTEHLLN